MDDDISIFGTSVWGTPSESPTVTSPPKDSFPALPTSSPLVATSSVDDQFDDFDDFGPPAPTETVEEHDDDFGDFGDFGEPQEMAAPEDFEQEVGFGEEVQIAGPSEAKWEPLRLHPMPSRAELQRQIDAILESIWPDEDLSKVTTDDDIRQVEGLSQILVTAESRDLYNNLFHSPPPTKPPNWTRSRIRRQHLISLGIPVNLDEVLPHANGKPLPPLQITTRPMSAPPGPRHAAQSNNHAPGTTNNSRTGTPRAGTPQSASRAEPSSVQQLGLGPKPELDESKVSDLLNLESDTLSLLPLATLERHLADLQSQTVKTSALLTHLLQTREALQQDSETYNGLIAELVGEAQKMKTGKPRPAGKRGSGFT